MKNRFFSIIILLVLSIQLMANSTASQAKSAYKAKEYDEAVQLYKQIAAENPSSEVYYNLGNAYFRQKDTISAILSYERALCLNQSNQDARYNLDLCRSRISAGNTQHSEWLVFHKMSNWISSYSPAFWGWLSFAFAVIIAVVSLLRKNVDASMPQSILKYLSFLSALLLVVAAVFAFLASAKGDKSDAYVLMQDASLYSDMQTSSKVVSEVQRGSLLQLKEKGAGTWMLVESHDGAEGWLNAKVECIDIFD